MNVVEGLRREFIGQSMGHRMEQVWSVWNWRKIGGLQALGEE